MGYNKINSEDKSKRLQSILNSKYFIFGITIAIFLILYLFGIFNYKSFSRPQVFYNLFIDLAPTIVLTVGVTFVLLTGNIDLSGGSIIAFVCMFLSKLMKDTNLSVGVIVLLSLIVGAAFGLIQGYLIAYFSMQSFIVTLAGQFVARGATALLSVDTIDIERANYVSLSSLRIPLFEGYISLGSVI
ncbi:MAG: sugar ABC transporter permease YjfF, partial [Clostridiales bacterium]|nr:sugar ABC transporter permease YjfF [Clostridiales bacterium]